MKAKKVVQQRAPKLLTAPERETIVRISDEDDTWTIATASPKYKNKFIKLGWAGTDIDVYNGYVEFTVPERCVTFRKLEKKKVSQSTKDALLKARLSRKSLNSN
jgi:hypothetical protein